MLRYFILFIISVFHSGFASTPTQRYLEEHPIQSIQRHYCDILKFDSEGDYKNLKNVWDNIPFLLQISDNETAHFAFYHAAPLSYMLFQDAIKAVFEEVLDISIRDDFYFLRIPLIDPVYQYKTDNCKKENFKLSEQVPLHDLDSEIQLYVLDPLNAAFLTNVKIKDLDDDVIVCILKLFLYYRDLTRVSVAEPIIEREQEVLYQIAEGLVSYYGEDQERLLQALQTHLSVSGLAEEDLLIFLEKHDEWLHAHWNDFLWYFYDASPKSQKRYVCCNMSLFANYLFNDESSAYIFSNNESMESGEVHFIPSLEKLLMRLGMRPELAEELLVAGQEILKQENTNTGVLFQIFDTSEIPFALIDRTSYLSMSCGHPVREAEFLPTSQLIKGELPFSLDGKDIQLRLFMDNQTTLNPYAKLSIKRYDCLRSGTDERIVDCMKAKLRNQNFDPEKRALFIQELNHVWMK